MQPSPQPCPRATAGTTYYGRQPSTVLKTLRIRRPRACLRVSCAGNVNIILATEPDALSPNTRFHLRQKSPMTLKIMCEALHSWPILEPSMGFTLWACLPCVVICVSNHVIYWDYVTINKKTKKQKTRSDFSCVAVTGRASTIASFSAMLAGS